MAEYPKAFTFALILHLSLGLLLVLEFNTKHPALTKEVMTQRGNPTELEDKPKEIVKAQSIEAKEVNEVLNRLKAEKAAKLKQENQRQQALAKEAAKMKQERLLEQQKIKKLKDEAKELARQRQKTIEEEKLHLKQLALEKEKEKKQLEDLKKQARQAEAKAAKLAELKKQEVEKAAVKLRQEQEILAKKLAEEKKTAEKKAEEKKAEELRVAKAAAEEKKAADDAAQKAKLAGEIDKYKALIVNAIGRRWILPENIDSSLSSQFRIRLAPGGTVLEVTLIKSSGDSILDRSAQTAIYKASPLPVPTDPQSFEVFRDISLTVRPENVRG